MRARIREINRALKFFDKDLFADNTRSFDRIDINRRKQRFLPYEVQGETLWVLAPLSERVICLTDNWVETGCPVDWGIEPILAKLRAIDLWNRTDWQEWFTKQAEEHDESKKRDRRNNIESFLLDNRRSFAQATEGYTTRTLINDHLRSKGDQYHGYRK